MSERCVGVRIGRTFFESRATTFAIWPLSTQTSCSPQNVYVFFFLRAIRVLLRLNRSRILASLKNKNNENPSEQVNTHEYNVYGYTGFDRRKDGGIKWGGLAGGLRVLMDLSYASQYRSPLHPCPTPFDKHLRSTANKFVKRIHPLISVLRRAFNDRFSLSPHPRSRLFHVMSKKKTQRTDDDDDDYPSASHLRRAYG